MSSTRLFTSKTNIRAALVNNSAHKIAKLQQRATLACEALQCFDFDWTEKWKFQSVGNLQQVCKDMQWVQESPEGIQLFAQIQGTNLF